jgi:hypothetical protein
MGLCELKIDHGRRDYECVSVTRSLLLRIDCNVTFYAVG